ncbi:MAG: hypothetical protein FWC41_03740 [Firmicutes bacterium]|nr:hypothetical protein [Bacillota bacterium]
MNNKHNISIDAEIKHLRNNLKSIKRKAEEILETYITIEASLPSLIYDLKKAGILKWIKHDSSENL